ncbi:MAG: LysR family transcriptional regulator [Cyanobacteria bacterium CRU_2_1]|nr:LysR family transcriptional regulator [Cyanobacteria bacterium RU_5_0]NJR61454.1 LysR family transcriptional regulator [Cyanobacteria bacterium CRU_2_1]
MNLDNVKLSQLRALVTVAECSNFSEAALQLKISQSAVSHAIASLEQELGVVLLSRGRHGAMLTPVGERVLAHARMMLCLLKDIGKEANLFKGLQGGHLRIASFRSVATHILPAVMAEFRRRFPAISLDISESGGCIPVEQSLREGRADIGITILPTTDEFEVWELVRDDYVALIPLDYQPNSPLTWKQLFAHPLILSSEGDRCRQCIETHCAKLGYSLNPTYEVREDSTIVSMVNQGLGIALLPRLAAEPLPPRVQARPLPMPLERVIGVCVLTEALHSPAVYAFLDILKEMSQSGKLLAA